MTQTIAGFADNQQYGFGGNSMTEGQKVSLRLRTCVVFPRVILRVAVRVDLRELGRVLPALPQRLLDGVRQPGRGTSATKTSMRALSAVWGAKFDIPRPRVTATFTEPYRELKVRPGGVAAIAPERSTPAMCTTASTFAVRCRRGGSARRRSWQSDARTAVARTCGRCRC